MRPQPHSPSADATTAERSSREEFVRGRFESLARALNAATADMDEDVIALGNKLGEAIEIFSAFTTTFQSLTLELDSPALHEAAEVLRQVARDVSAMGHALADEHTALIELSALSCDMGGRINQLRQTIQTIAILAVNSQIAAAAVQSQKEGFNSFTAEIIRLTKDIETTIENYFKEFQAVDTTLTKAAETQAKFATSQRRILATMANQLHFCLNQVDSRIKKNAETSRQIETVSAQIGHDMAVIVQALQIGDITRQRLEHVCTALERTESDLFDAPNSTVGEAQRLSIARGLARLEAGQLSHAATDFRTEIHRLAEATQRLARETDGLIDVSGTMFGATGRRGTSFLRDLQHELAVLRALLQGCVQAKGEVKRVISKVASALDQLMHQVNSVTGIEVDMRLIGLNMGFKCARLGAEGSSLRVIAQELRVNAHQIVGDTEVLLSSVNAVVTGASRLCGEHSDASEQATTLELHMAKALHSFEHVGARLDDALSTITQKSQRVHDNLSSATGQIFKIGRAADSFMNLCELLRELGDGPVIAEHEAIVNDWLAHLTKQQYTMASERHVHGTMTGAAAAGSISAEKKQPASVDDFLF